MGTPECCPQVLSVSRQARSREVQQRVRDAVASLAEEGRRPSFYQVAQRAGVSRSTLYRNPALRELVEHARTEAAGRLGEASSRVKKEGGSFAESSLTVSRYLPCELPRFLYGVCLLEGTAAADGGG
ncbi:DUF6262 family protein [Adlercreutzia caecimuris]|uniref:DUF6262 family protein n=1 Tax=Adlercreutzia caecimuris TaxID=671266 RepID=UPI000EC4C33D|nr:DUF6262 family protein [Adlercreutzia caecimuris]